MTPAPLLRNKPSFKRDRPHFEDDKRRFDRIKAVLNDAEALAKVALPMRCARRGLGLRRPT